MTTSDQTSPSGIATQPGWNTEDDLDLLAESGRRVNKLTIALMAAVLIGIAFIGGVLVQKQIGTSSGGFPSGGMSAMGGGMPGGMTGGYGGFGGGRGSGASQPGTSGSTEVSTGTPVVVGTVAKLSGRTLTVKNFADESVTVKVPKGTTISNSSDSALDGLAKGDSVSVVGEKAADGTVTASSITAN